MCFILNKVNGMTPKPKKATKDIKVYKVIQKDGWSWLYTLIIEGSAEKWTRGWHYYITKSNPFKIVNEPANSVNIGPDCFHSFKTKREANSLWREYPHSDAVVEMIIPKGALYYENEKEYVSDQIIFPKL